MALSDFPLEKKLDSHKNYMMKVKMSYHHFIEQTEGLELHEVTSLSGASLVAQWRRICLPIQEPGVRSLAWEDPLEKEKQPTPVFLPRESCRQRSLAGDSPRGHKELNTT